MRQAMHRRLLEDEMPLPRATFAVPSKPIGRQYYGSLIAEL